MPAWHLVLFAWLEVTTTDFPVRLRHQSRDQEIHGSPLDRLQQHNSSTVAPLTHASAAAGQLGADCYRGHPARRPLHADVSVHPKAGFTPSACNGVDFARHLDWHAAGAQARARVAPRVVRLDRRAGH